MLYLNDYRSIFVSLCFSKKMLMEKNGNSANQKWLYHGSISTVIKDICVQNLDWRLCGLNGVAYGQGSYFALNARPQIYVFSSSVSWSIYNGKLYDFVSSISWFVA